MKSITTLAWLSLIGIIGSLLALNYYVNIYKPQQQAAAALKLPVPSSVDFPKDSLKVVPDMVAPVTATTPVPNPAAAMAVPTNSASTKPSAHAPIKPKQNTHAPTVVPKSADVVVAPPVKPVLPAKVVPKTVAPDAGITAKGGDVTVEIGLTKGLHYVVIGSFADENNAKLAMRNYPLKNLSIHKDGKLYRLSAGAFKTTADAKHRMNELQRQSVESIMIQH
jgi:cytoskeletal protein RodZ